MTKSQVQQFLKVKKKKSSIYQGLRPFGISIDNFYITDFVCENSAIMAKASKLRVQNTFFKEKSIYN